MENDARVKTLTNSGSLHNRRIAIVGGGPGGLASAMLLAHAGADVTIYERHAQLGGRSSAIEGQTEAGAFRFDTGPTFFLYPQILRDIFTRCGLRMEDTITLKKLDENYDLVFENGPSLTVTSDIDVLEREIARIDMQDAGRVREFIADNRAKFRNFIPVLQRPFNSILDLLRPDMLRAFPRLRPLSSVDRDLSRYFRDPKTRLAFSFQSKYLGMSPYRCPSLFTILSFMEHEYGIYHPVGGTMAVMEAMGQAAERLGVTIRLNTPVREILTRKGHATGVLTDHGPERADAIVINADFGRAMTNLVPDRKRRRWKNKFIERKKYSCSTFMMYLGIEGTVPSKGHHTIFLSETYDRNFAEIEAGQSLSEEASLYIQNACVTDPDQAPTGHSTLYVLMPVGHLRENGLDWNDERRTKARSLVMARLEKAGFKDIEKRIRFEKIITPAEWEARYDVHKGAVFNLAHNLGQMLHRRPHNRFEDIKGVYLAGGGTHPGSGLPVIFEGARITSDLVIKDFSPRRRSARKHKRPLQGASHVTS
uniref:phytoene desaturase family protein n=1 Tax=Gluconobacter thailandicus TaxID=257438 RepID=UPI0009ED3925|nr:phytoene desaturase family protein [Gluconobacter thailandicus]